MGSSAYCRIAAGSHERGSAFIFFGDGYISQSTGRFNCLVNRWLDLYLLYRLSGHKRPPVRQPTMPLQDLALLGYAFRHFSTPDICPLVFISITEIVSNGALRDLFSPQTLIVY